MRNKLFQYTVGNSILVVSILATINFRSFFIIERVYSHECPLSECENWNSVITGLRRIA